MNTIEIPIDTIIQGDCIEILQNLPSNSIDLIFADPPYNMQTEGELLRVNGTSFNGVTDSWDKFESLSDYDTFCKKWLSECQRILKPNGAIWVIGSFQNIYRIGYIMQDLGFWILNDVIWSKPNAVPNFGGTRFQNSHETLIWCSKSKQSKYTFNYKTMKTLNNNKQMKSIWEIGICIGSERLKDKNGKKIHSTQKPEKLLYNIIISSSKPNDIVLDPFFGTGTTGAIAKRAGRHFVGIEREQLYIEHAYHRIQNTKIEPDKYSTLELEKKPPRVSIRELIHCGYLSIGQQLFSKDKKHFAIVCEDGNVVSENGKKGSIHSTSAHYLNTSNHNGWDYFYYEDSLGKLLPINDLRYVYEKEQTKNQNS